MVAGLDIGNSTVSLKFFDQKTIFNEKKVWQTHLFELESLKKEIQLKKCEVVIVSSVVRELNTHLKTCLTRLGYKVYFVDQSSSSFIDFSDYESYMGPDRVSEVIGARTIHEGPFCVVGMGTAITFSVIGQNDTYIGGFIMPGVKTMLKSLSSNTSILPELEIHQKPESFLGLNTKDNIKNGIFYLIFHGIKGILEEIKSSYKVKNIIGTGGFSHFFKNLFDFVDKDLIFKGLKHMYFFDIRGSK